MGSKKASHSPSAGSFGSFRPLSLYWGESLALPPFLISINRNLLKRGDIIPAKIIAVPELIQKIARWKLLSKTFVFTNGVFDILHPGHIFSLSQAAREADFLVVGI